MQRNSSTVTFVQNASQPSCSLPGSACADTTTLENTSACANLAEGPPVLRRILQASIAVMNTDWRLWNLFGITWLVKIMRRLWGANSMFKKWLRFLHTSKATPNSNLWARNHAYQSQKVLIQVSTSSPINSRHTNESQHVPLDLITSPLRKKRKSKPWSLRSKRSKPKSKATETNKNSSS